MLKRKYIFLVSMQIISVAIFIITIFVGLFLSRSLIIIGLIIIPIMHIIGLVLFDKLNKDCPINRKDVLIKYMLIYLSFIFMSFLLYSYTETFQGGNLYIGPEQFRIPIILIYVFLISMLISTMWTHKLKSNKLLAYDISFLFIYTLFIWFGFIYILGSNAH